MLAFSYFRHYFSTHFLCTKVKCSLAAARISEISWNIFLLTHISQCDINHWRIR